MKVQITIDDTTYEVEVEDSEEGYPSVPEPPPARTTIQSSVVSVAPKGASASTNADHVDETKVCRSPVAGIVIRVHAQAGKELQANDLIVVLEAMKMETRISSPAGGRLKALKVAPGDAVKLNQILAEFE